MFQVYTFIFTQQSERRNDIFENLVLISFNKPNSIEHKLGAGHLAYNAASTCYYLYVEDTDEKVES